MQQKKLYTPFKVLSMIVLVAMVGAILYAFSISLMYWNGIGV